MSKIIPLGKKTYGSIIYYGLQGSFNEVTDVYEYFIVKMDSSDGNNVIYGYNYQISYSDFVLAFSDPTILTYTQTNNNYYSDLILSSLFTF